MRELTMEQTEFAVGRLVQIVEAREITQTELERLSAVNQSTISKIFSNAQGAGGEKYHPSGETLKKLFQALGLKLSDILNESNSLPNEILGYLATPLTSLSELADKELRRVVSVVRAAAADEKFGSPGFEIYWPGDHTHPLKHADIPANQVYITDRSRAATYDFIVLLCAAPSFGVGQENEIATQAGVPAIRLIPEKGMSRMMIGSFIGATDIKYSGSLEKGIEFDVGQLQEALHEIRKTYYRRRAMDRGPNMDSFGGRLKKLIDERCGGEYEQLAKDLAINLTYLHILMKEPFVVSNPSGRLLGRIAVRLGERVAYLLGETDESDSVWIESTSSWRRWIEKSPNVSARAALTLRDQWRNEYHSDRRLQLSSATSFRNLLKPMTEIDWDKRYQAIARNEAGKSAAQRELL